ncbi:MAG: FliA/WhiG family RNA polymerase sigma factor [Planctomycetes bacterium]|nr:FliA/WhiG family RNA polymerase sigma factor [Planctomycetota bacterium]
MSWFLESGMPEMEKGPNENPEDAIAAELWRQYTTARSAKRRRELKEALVAEYIHLPKFHAERMASGLPKSVQVEDLVQEGMFGLMDAIDKFDPSRGIKFKTYCGTRIRGAMLDGLRSQDWASRLLRQRSNQAERIKQDYLSRHGRPPTDEELADEMQLAPEVLNKKTQPRSMVTISDRRADSGEERNASIDTLKENAEDNPAETVQRADMMEVLTSSLSDKERSILYMYYQEGLNLREIGQQLNLTESRVCQIHGNVLKRLRDRLEDQHDQFNQD